MQTCSRMVDDKEVLNISSLRRDSENSSQIMGDRCRQSAERVMLWTKKGHSTTQHVEIEPWHTELCWLSHLREGSSLCSASPCGDNLFPLHSPGHLSYFCHQPAVLGVVVLTTNCLFHSNRQGRVLVDVAFIPLSLISELPSVALQCRGSSSQSGQLEL